MSDSDAGVAEQFVMAADRGAGAGGPVARRGVIGMGSAIDGAPGPPAGSYDADVVILSLDRAEDTAAAIHSALAQTGVTRHVFVVDQGSRPENLEALAAAIEGFRDVSLVALGCNYGVAGGATAAPRSATDG